MKNTFWLIAITLFSVAPTWVLGAGQPPQSGKCSVPMMKMLETANINLSDLTQGDPFYYTSNLSPRPVETHSKIPHLPFYSGYMSTNDTYRFVSVAEQVFTMIGEGKHGLWRVQENGVVREYRRSGITGLSQDTDVNDAAVLSILKNDYSHYLTDESWSGYKFPSEQTDSSGYLQFVDLSIYHPKYQQRYHDHPPIDLPMWYCTMSGHQYPYAQKAMAFAFAQPAANQVGPLGKRAGLDIRENYTNVLRLNLFEDANVWANTGSSDEVDWQAVDLNKTRAEFYLVERPFFNEKHLFLTAVFNNHNNDDFSYIRPDGEYFDALTEKGVQAKSVVTHQPRFYLQRPHHGANYTRAAGTKLYGVHHPNRAEFSGGGACPMKGGDWAKYPETTGGAGWPTNYQEVTPLCDAVLIDIKLTTNLDGKTWNSPRKYLANAGTGQKVMEYTIDPSGYYGEFTQSFLLDRGITNPDEGYIGPVETIRYKSVQPPVGYVLPDDSQH
ncbi:hypothetical protein ACODM8_19110 [Vibrio ostreicida]|uniref:hypothetical protein n=1 Tax=Vibrio ostreicida TaxID=526588 RepID=UPI003B5BF490